MKNTLILIVMITCLGLFSCAPYVEIEQKAELASITNCEYSVRTYIWVRNYPDHGDMFIEKSFHQRMVSINDINIYKARQMAKALAVKALVEESLETNPCLK